MKYVYEVEYKSKRDYNYTQVERFDTEDEAIDYAVQLNEGRIGEDAKNSDIIVTKLELDDDGDIDSCWGEVWSADEWEASRKANRVVVTVERQKKDWSQGWTEDYTTLEDALEAACEDWNHLTKEEQKENVIYVYVDEIIQEDDEDHDEDRKSWHDGYTPIETFEYQEEEN